MPQTAATSPSQNRRGILIMLLAILSFTLMDALAKGLVARYPLPQVVFLRYAGQALLVALILRGRLPALMVTRFPFLHVLRSATQLGATAFFFAALRHIGLAEASALTDLYPVLITLGAALFLGEALTRPRVLAVLMALCGALIVMRPGTEAFSISALYPLGAAFCFAANALLTRFVGTQESFWVSMIYGSMFGTLATALLVPGAWQPMPAADWGLFAVLTLLGTGAQLLLIRAFSMAEASAIAPIAYSGTVMAAFWGVLFYQDWPDVWTLTGALVIIASGLYVWRQESRDRPRDPAQTQA